MQTAAAQLPIPEKERYTYADYAALPEGAPYQLIDGELVMTASPNIQHQRIVRRLLRVMDAFVEENDLGEVFVSPVDVYLSETDTPVPDLVFVAKERLGIVGAQKIEGAPDLVVEVLSPSTGYYDLRKKKRLYAEAGVAEYWVVDPLEESVEVHTNAGGAFDLHQRAEEGGRAASQTIGGFSVGLSDLF